MKDVFESKSNMDLPVREYSSTAAHRQIEGVTCSTQMLHYYYDAMITSCVYQDLIRSTSTLTFSLHQLTVSSRDFASSQWSAM